MSVVGVLGVMCILSIAGLVLKIIDLILYWKNEEEEEYYIEEVYYKHRNSPCRVVNQTPKRKRKKK